MRGYEQVLEFGKRSFAEFTEENIDAAMEALDKGLFGNAKHHLTGIVSYVLAATLDHLSTLPAIVAMNDDSIDPNLRKEFLVETNEMYPDQPTLREYILIGMKKDSVAAAVTVVRPSVGLYYLADVPLTVASNIQVQRDFRKVVRDGIEAVMDDWPLEIFDYPDREPYAILSPMRE